MPVRPEAAQLRRPLWLALAAVAVLAVAAALIWLARPHRADRGGAVPAARSVYLGVYAPATTSAGAVTDRVTALERRLGRRFAIDQHYYDWTNPFPGSLERDDRAAGRIPLITWQPDGVSLAAIAAGRDDDLVRRRAADVRAFGRPVLLRFAHEPNGDWFDWSAAYDRGTPIGGNTAAAYVRAWRHLHAVFAAAGATNVAWVWSPNAEDFPASNTAARYYPGDDVVDWVGIDAYDGGPATGWRGLGRLIAPLYDAYAERKPVMLSEVGAANDRGRGGAFIDGLAAELPMRYPRVRAVVWFDQSEWRLDAAAATMAAFGRLAASSRFSARPPA